MANWKKLASGAAGAAGGAGLDVDDVFRIHPYIGNGTAGRTINVGLDMATEGGLVITKRRFGGTASFIMHDTGRGTNVNQALQGTAGEFTSSNYIRDLASTGFTVGSDYDVNGNNQELCSWNFLENPDFFEVKTFSTTYNTDPSYLTHSLNCDLGMAVFIAKNPGSQSYNRIVWHKDVGTYYYLRLNDTVSRRYDSSNPIVYTPSQKQFTFNYPMSQLGDRMIHGGQETTNWTAYFFGHHNNTGVFGPSGDQDIIKCGSYTGSTSSPFPNINLGFEPQFLLLKNLTGSGNWHVIDTARGVASGSRYERLYWNDDAYEENGGAMIGITPTGFEFTDWSGDINQGGYTFIYMAIRKGQMSAPDSATDVFKAVKSINPGDPAFVSSFPVDMSIHKDTTGGAAINGARLINNRTLNINSNAVESGGNDEMVYDRTNGFYSPYDYGSPPGSIGSTNFIGWLWKRAPKFFDAVTFTGDGTSNRTISHQLSVSPDMVWVKARTTTGQTNWYISHYGLNKYAQMTSNYTWQSGASTYSPVTDSVFTPILNNSGVKYIAYLFASLDGISKVGSYTGNDTSQNIDCGFSNGAAFVMVKRTSDTGDFLVFDTTRGINSGADPMISLNNTSAENSSYDSIDAYSSGFTINSPSGADYVNNSGETYMFYAIAA